MNPARRDSMRRPPAMGVDGKPAGPFAIEDCPLGAADSQVTELAALLRTAQALTATLHLPAVLEAIADRALALIGAQHCAVFELDPLDDLLKARAARGMPPSHAFWPTRLGRGAAGGAAVRSQGILIPSGDSHQVPWSDEPAPE